MSNLDPKTRDVRGQKIADAGGRTVHGYVDTDGHLRPTAETVAAFEPRPSDSDRPVVASE